MNHNPPAKAARNPVARRQEAIVGGTLPARGSWQSYSDQLERLRLLFEQPDLYG
jgi:hypothetical protein